MYGVALLAHSWVRWVVLILGLVAAVRGILGMMGRRQWTATDQRVTRLFGIALDLQVLIGFLLYFALSPITKAALQNFGEAMQNATWRFWAVEHVTGMIVGMVLAQIGRARIRKATDDLRRHRTAAIFYTLALIAILVSIPWPVTPNARPLFRW